MNSNKRYRGKLSVQQIAEGIELALQNARDLMDDATLLFERKSYGRALALSCSAMEEIGKVHVLKAMVRIPPGNQKLWREQWANFRRHERKTAHGRTNILFDELRADAPRMFDAVVSEVNRAMGSESERQAGLYVDFSGKRWESPSDTSRASALGFLRDGEQAVERLERMAEFGLLSPRALEVEHDVLSPLNAARSRESELTVDYIADVQAQLPGKMREYCRRLVDEGILSADADIEIMDVPLRQVLRQED